MLTIVIGSTKKEAKCCHHQGRGVDNFLEVCVCGGWGGGGGGGGAKKDYASEIFALPHPLLHDHTPIFGIAVL